MADSEKHTQAWALGYLRGSAGGYRRGTVSIRRVRASVDLALRNGVTPEQARHILLEHALRWDPQHVTLADTES
jgi:hypothetical protein